MRQQELAGAGEDLPHGDLRAATLRGLRWTSISRLTSELLLVGSMVVLARLIPPAQFGPYAVAIIIQDLALGIPGQGIGNALVQQARVHREDLQTGHALAILVGFALAGFTLAAGSAVAQPLFGHTTADLVRMMAPLCVITALGIVPSAILGRRLAFNRLSAIEIVGSVTRVGASIALAVAGLGGAALVLGTIAGAAAITSVAWISSPPPAPRIHRNATRGLLGYGVPASLAAISWTCFRNCDYTIVGARLGTLQAGFYFRAYTLAVEYQKKLSIVMGQVAFPVLARTGSARELGGIRCQMVRMLTVVVFPLILLLAIVAPVLVPWLLGPAWAPVVVPTQILAVGGAATLVIDTAGVVMMAQGRSRALLGFGVAHFGAYCAAVLVVAGQGIVAVAAAAAVVHGLFLLVAYALMLRSSAWQAMRLLCGELAPALVSCVALLTVAGPASMGLSAAHAPAAAQLVSVCLLAAAAYLGALRIGFPEAWRALGRFVGSILPIDRLPPALKRLRTLPTSA